MQMLSYRHRCPRGSRFSLPAAWSAVRWSKQLNVDSGDVPGKIFAMRTLLADLTAALDQERLCVYCVGCRNARLDAAEGGRGHAGLRRRQPARHARRRLRRGRSHASAPCACWPPAATAGGADLLSRRQLRLGRRPHLRRPHDHPRRSSRLRPRRRLLSAVCAV